LEIWKLLEIFNGIPSTKTLITPKYAHCARNWGTGSGYGTVLAREIVGQGG